MQITKLPNCLINLPLQAMAQKKLVRFAELTTFSNVLQYPEGMPGNWHNFFKNNNPLTLELACGKGEYAVGLGQLYPDQNFLGVDLKGNRIWVGAKKALNNGLTNVGFLRTQIDHITQYFTPGEVQNIWITFPDPQLRLSKAKKRLTHPRFLRLYQQIMAKDGFINLKTDSPDLYHFTKLVIGMYGCTIHEDIDNLYALPERSEALQIKTHYEGLDIAQSNRIHYIRFSLPDVIEGPEKDKALQQLLQHEQTD